MVTQFCLELHSPGWQETWQPSRLSLPSRITYRLVSGMSGIGGFILAHGFGGLQPIVEVVEELGL